MKISKLALIPALALIATASASYAADSSTTTKHEKKHHHGKHHEKTTKMEGKGEAEKSAETSKAAQ